MRGVHHGRHLGRIPFPLTSDRAPRVRTHVRNESPMSTEALKIEKDSVVRFHYTVSEQGQEPLETSKERDPMAILYGHGNIIPGLDKALEGNDAGDSFGVDVAAADASGERRDGLTQRVPKQHFQVQNLPPCLPFLLTPTFLPLSVPIPSFLLTLLVFLLHHPFPAHFLPF